MSKRIVLLPIGLISSLLLLSIAVVGQTPPRAAAAPPIPQLRKQGTATQLTVDGKPFLMLAGELHNSSASSIEYMKPIWGRLKAMNLNTVLATVSWELIEPRQGEFDFRLVDAMIRDARQQNFRLVFLWFGSWKNGVSSYAPLWVKADLKRFPRVQNKSGFNLEVLSTFSEAARDADASAFVRLMRHIKQVDSERTVIMMQVENEVGILGDARDRSPLAEAAWSGQVPRELMDYLQKHKASLLPELNAIWETRGFKTEGTWSEVFGTTPEAEEIFTVWHYGRYIGEIIAAGKKEYPLPMFVNAWLVQDEQQKPGN
jgi:beta-galactosidase GanA